MANSLLTFYGIEGFALDGFAHFVILTEIVKNRFIYHHAIIKSVTDAVLVYLIGYFIT